jgi:hypothetical protein
MPLLEAAVAAKLRSSPNDPQSKLKLECIKVARRLLPHANAERVLELGYQIHDWVTSSGRRPDRRKQRLDRQTSQAIQDVCNVLVERLRPFWIEPNTARAHRNATPPAQDLSAGATAHLARLKLLLGEKIQRGY